MVRNRARGIADGDLSRLDHEFSAIGSPLYPPDRSLQLLQHGESKTRLTLDDRSLRHEGVPVQDDPRDSRPRSFAALIDAWVHPEGIIAVEGVVLAIHLGHEL